MTEKPTRRTSAARTPIDRLAVLTGREKALALKARLRHRYTFDLPLELYEDLLTQAEAWDQPLPDVVRACIRSGLDSIRRFGGASPTNPFAYGGLNPPTQTQLDPSGYGRPAGQAIAPLALTPTGWDMPWPLPYRGDPPQAMRFVPPNIKPGMLPNGSTPMADLDPPTEPKTVDPFGDNDVDPF